MEQVEGEKKQLTISSQGERLQICVQEILIVLNNNQLLSQEKFEEKAELVVATKEAQLDIVAEQHVHSASIQAQLLWDNMTNRQSWGFIEK